MLIARARAAAAARRGQGGDAGGGAGAPGPSSGYLSYPANGPITSGFGMRYHPILHIWRLHSGTDFGIGCGTPVYAAAPGVVISAGWAGGYGNRIVIDHGMVRGVDLATTYNHLTRIVAGGGHVTRGQLIAYSGTTGLSTGCHLHFEVLVNGSYVNPTTWL
jgi:murein DD-endopeptidase MepM/ murein hydrolase activator NlpD